MLVMAHDMAYDRGMMLELAALGKIDRTLRTSRQLALRGLI
jgi:hypothetical protein